MSDGKSADAGATIRFRIASWNVLYGEMGTAEQIGEALAGCELDAVCFCEVPGEDWTERVGRVVGMGHWVLSDISSANHKDKFKSVLSRTPLRGPREIEPFGTGWWPCTILGADTTVGGVELTIVSLHVPGSAHGEASIPAHPSMSRIGYVATDVLPREPAAELLMMGDYNDRMDSANLEFFEAAGGMRNAWRDIGFDLADRFSFSQRGEGLEHAGVIDHIYYRTGTGTRAVDGGILELDPPLSDHKPVWAEFAIPAPQ